MKKVIRVKMPDGSQWDVPAEIVAHSRATYYANHDTGQTSGEKHSKVYKDELEIGLNDHEAMLDWAANNMNWSDVVESASMHKAGSVDYQEGWVNGDKKVVELDDKADKP